MPGPNTLPRFGVRINGAPQGPILQPKIQYRFRLLFLNLGGGGVNSVGLTLNINQCSKPKISYEPTEVHSYNSRAYFAGKHTWEAVNFTVRDNITHDAVALIDRQIQMQVDTYAQTSLAAAADYKFGMLIQSMDGGNVVVLDTWELQGCFFTNVDYGEYNYSSSESVNISATVRYDNALHYVGEFGPRLMADPGAQGISLGGVTL